MSRSRGRPRRQYQIRVRSERRARIDYDTLAEAVLEHAAIQERRASDEPAHRQPADHTPSGSPVTPHPAPGAAEQEEPS